jgi:hypothetical protein
MFGCSQCSIYLSFRVANYVCRIDKCEDPTILEKSKRKRGKGKKQKSSSKRMRGAEGERTCPHCDRVFTSVLGCSYHVSKYSVVSR